MYTVYCCKSHALALLKLHLKQRGFRPGLPVRIPDGHGVVRHLERRLRPASQLQTAPKRPILRRKRHEHHLKYPKITMSRPQKPELGASGSAAPAQESLSLAFQVASQNHREQLLASHHAFLGLETHPKGSKTARRSVEEHENRVKSSKIEENRLKMDQNGTSGRSKSSSASLRSH